MRADGTNTESFAASKTAFFSGYTTCLSAPASALSSSIDRSFSAANTWRNAFFFTMLVASCTKRISSTALPLLRSDTPSLFSLNCAVTCTSSGRPPSHGDMSLSSISNSLNSSSRVFSVQTGSSSSSSSLPFLKNRLHTPFFFFSFFSFSFFAPSTFISSFAILRNSTMFSSDSFSSSAARRAATPASFSFFRLYSSMDSILSALNSMNAFQPWFCRCRAFSQHTLFTANCHHFRGLSSTPSAGLNRLYLARRLCVFSEATHCSRSRYCFCSTTHTWSISLSLRVKADARFDRSQQRSQSCAPSRWTAP